MRPDLDGILSPDEMPRLADAILARGGNVNRILSASHADEVDVHQLNCTYYSALGEDDDRYLAARAIQLFARGIPQLYYVGLLAGANDHEAVERTGEGRAINRHDYTTAEIEAALERPVVQRLLDLIRLRATHPAFDGRLTVEAPSAGKIRMVWTSGEDCCALDVDVRDGSIDITDAARAEWPRARAQGGPRLGRWRSARSRMMRTQTCLNARGRHAGVKVTSTNTYRERGRAAVGFNSSINTVRVAPSNWADPEPRRS